MNKRAKSRMIADFKTRFMPLFRRSSTTSATSAKSDAASSIHSVQARPRSNRSKTSLLSGSRKQRRFSKSQGRSDGDDDDDGDTAAELAASVELPASPHELPTRVAAASSSSAAATQSKEHLPSSSDQSPGSSKAGKTIVEADTDGAGVELRLQEPSPEQVEQLSRPPARPKRSVVTAPRAGVSTESVARRQSLAHNSQQKLISTLLLSNEQDRGQSAASDYFGDVSALPVISTSMMHRKIWVKRPGASATLVQINEEDLVDDVRDMILKKYANSLGRTFDSPDVNLRIVARDLSHRGTAQESRALGPEEHMARTLDLYYPNGQTVDEALIIEVPHRRTPRNSPRVQLPYYHAVQEDTRPNESDQGYFPAMIPVANASPHPASTISIAGSSGSGHHHSIAVLNTGQVPPLPSPGGRGSRHHRPKFPRNNTSSPTTLTGQAPHYSSGEGSSGQRLTLPPTSAPNPPPLPTPPLATIPSQQQRVSTPPPRVSSPRPQQKAKRPSKKNTKQTPDLPGSLLDGAVPPINVLIVEDNIINLRLLEAFMKRLKVRWSTAMNGRDAVSKWREGGFHLVLMDIQLPIMNGLDATKEIRRIESLNGVGVFAVKSSGEKGKKQDDDTSAKDKLDKLELFKSPVIIVALTASSLQSDRHEALAAGCNDFLTKPVNFVWLERKVMEWGCMQALIDFDGWRKWKDVSQNNKKNKAAAQSSATKSPLSSTFKSPTVNSITSSTSTESKPNLASSSSSPPPPNTLVALNEQGESTNTVDTVDTIHSVDSGTTNSSETATPEPETQPSTAPPTAASNVPPVYPTASSSTSPTTASASPPPVSVNTGVGAKTSPTTAHRPSPLQSSTSVDSPTRRSPPLKSPRDAKKDGPKSPKEDRRWKRSSLGGLTGVREEEERGEEGRGAKGKRVDVGA